MRFITQPCGHICFNQRDEPGFQVYDDMFECYICIEGTIREWGCESCDDKEIRKMRIKKKKKS